MPYGSIICGFYLLPKLMHYFMFLPCLILSIFALFWCIFQFVLKLGLLIFSTLHTLKNFNLSYSNTCTYLAPV